MADIFFDSTYLSDIQKEYVAFIDIMGTQCHMKKSIKETANYIFKLHSAIISSWREKPYHNVFIYPVMDGAYITARAKDDMVNIVMRIYRYLSKLFLEEKVISHLFLVRGAIAYGEVIHGHSVPLKASKAFELDLGYKNQLLLGGAMIDAYLGEKKAAPFGIYICDSAKKRNMRNSGSFSLDWKWFNSKDLHIDRYLLSKIHNRAREYFTMLKDPQHPLHYEDEKNRISYEVIG